MSRPLSAFVIAGTHSGVGKTTAALGIMAALRRHGLRVQPFKIGPDFIDPGLHAEVCGLPSYNLDSWMLSRNYNLSSFHRSMKGKDAAVVEGMMGLYDGVSGASEAGSTAEIAKQLDLPVVLVVDASAMARSAAAVALGYRLFDPKCRVAGVIFNRVGGEGHLRILKEALNLGPELECFGGLPFADQLKIPERHLGLMVAQENVLTPRFINQLARWIEDHVDLDRLLQRTRVTLRSSRLEGRREQPAQKEISIAIARDKAFCFYYPDNLDFLRAAGARLQPFSPITDRDLPAGTKGVYLGGGYPELYARELSENRPMRTAIRHFIEAGGPVYAECGGLMYLTNALIDGQNRKLPMVNAYAFKCRMLPRFKALGYREIVSAKKTFIPRGQSIRRHEFHYSELQGSLDGKKVEETYSIQETTTAKRREGYRYKNCLASYVHLHFGSNPAFAAGFVEACRTFSLARP